MCKYILRLKSPNNWNRYQDLSIHLNRRRNTQTTGLHLLEWGTVFMMLGLPNANPARSQRGRRTVGRTLLSFITLLKNSRCSFSTSHMCYEEKQCINWSYVNQSYHIYYTPSDSKNNYCNVIFSLWTGSGHANNAINQHSSHVITIYMVLIVYFRSLCRSKNQYNFLNTRPIPKFQRPVGLWRSCASPGTIFRMLWCAGKSLPIRKVYT